MIGKRKAAPAQGAANINNNRQQYIPPARRVNKKPADKPLYIVRH